MLPANLKNEERRYRSDHETWTRETNKRFDGARDWRPLRNRARYLLVPGL